MVWDQSSAMVTLLSLCITKRNADALSDGLPNAVSQRTRSIRHVDVAQ